MTEPVVRVRSLTGDTISGVEIDGKPLTEVRPGEWTAEAKESMFGMYYWAVAILLTPVLALVCWLDATTWHMAGFLSWIGAIGLTLGSFLYVGLIAHALYDFGSD